MNPAYYALNILLVSVVSLILLWLLYVFSISVIQVRKQGKLSKIATVLSAPVVFAGVLLDVVVNITLATVVFFDLPKEWTLSQRLSRYWKPGGTDWRCKLAGEVAKALLNPFDEGHIE